MKNNNNESPKPSWRVWLIKKLITSQVNKDDLLEILSNNNDSKTINDYDELDDNNENKLIKNIFNLNEINVEDLMVPRAEIISIDKKLNMNQILSLIERESHSRMPVYEQNLDNILGFVHIKDILKNVNVKNFSINNILREVLYVAPKSPVLDLLKRMRSSRKHMGLVVDEFGGVDGLVTIEDLVESIVGEIEDEHDAEDEDEIKFKKINENKIVVDSSYKLVDLEKNLNIEIKEIKDEEIDTVGGLVFFLAGKVPKKEEEFNYNEILNFKILSASDRRIDILEINKL